MPDTLVVLIVILILAVIWRGPKTLPQIGSILGRGVREARREAEKINAADASDDRAPKAD